MTPSFEKTSSEVFKKAIAVLFFAIFYAMFAASLLTHLFQNQVKSAELINVSSKQRMISQRILLLSEKIESGTDREQTLKKLAEAKRILEFAQNRRNVKLDALRFAGSDDLLENLDKIVTLYQINSEQELKIYSTLLGQNPKIF